MKLQAVAEVLGLRGREGEGGGLGLWASSSVPRGAGSGPCRQKPCPREKARRHSLVQVWSWVLWGTSSVKWGLGPGKAGFRAGDRPTFSAS